MKRLTYRNKSINNNNNNNNNKIHSVLIKIINYLFKIFMGLYDV